MWSGELRLETGQAEDVELSFVDQTEREKQDHTRGVPVLPW